MIKFLEDILYSKTKDSQSDILFAQWNYDKKIIPSTLQLVSNIFPHYSLHDESHSITIINNIVRILGKENIEKLSAIDIWLILEASYCHDIGMVVSSDKIAESLKSNEFVQFFKEILSDPKNSLYEFASLFEIEGSKIRHKANYFNLESNDGIKFIIAEYFRKIHADRSKEIIRNPVSELSLSSPRAVIPPRIVKLLADICASHTKSFDEVMKLPICEVGIDIEDAHPRFIACLLRIGDLLDLDNNRFSEVMLRTLSRVPLDTLNHKSKHLSIESFRVDKNIIEITARCENYDTASITQHWFNYLNTEISNQMNNWNNIVPFKELGYLPTIGNLKVELVNYDFIDGKLKPKFSVDNDRALALLQGAGIYDSPFQCIREILQNAVDSTLIRIWLEHPDIDLSTPSSPTFFEIAKQYPISVYINKIHTEGDMQNWQITIKDNGIGISAHDLKYLMHTGSSSKNREKATIIETMPIWMRPSGTFGIGFQSVFMLTDFVKIETKSFANEEYQIIEMNNPNGKNDGAILLKKVKTSHAVKPGVRLTFNYKAKKIPFEYSVSNKHKNASRILYNYDPFTNDSLDIEASQIIDEVLDFASMTTLGIQLFSNGSEILANDLRKKFDYFHQETSLELSFNSPKLHQNSRLTTYFKGQHAENSMLIEFIKLDVNILKENATEVLTLNRNKIKPTFVDQLYENILVSSFDIITKNFENIFSSDESKCLGSMYLNYYQRYYQLSKKFDISSFDHWKMHKIQISNVNAEKTIEDLLINIDTLILISDRSYNRYYGDVYSLTDTELTITFPVHATNIATTFLLFKARELFCSIESIERTDETTTTIYSKMKSQYAVAPSDLNDIVTRSGDTFNYLARVIIPCAEQYSTLRLKDAAHKPHIRHYKIDDTLSIQVPKMLSPFVREVMNDSSRKFHISLNSAVIDWVYENRYKAETSKQQIVDTYNEFCKNIDLNYLNTDAF